ncbi:probable methyltransferase At1g27930 [Amaranthus tricolor]|uniref:probable methyltransferase At1g27930 n=1 Tax=Amaranthus tricolor TaxID=29722 RepID=UPI0025829CA5|nr:probable methyltransferase At1g27930 [Amaranthus tricolor]
MKGNKTNNLNSNQPWLIAIAILLGIITGALLVSAFMGPNCKLPEKLSLSSTSPIRSSATSSSGRSIQSKAILHYATSKIIPQQTLEEVTESFNVLQSKSPCNFLVFGLGYDSLMWAGLNPDGTTLFLEESPEWVNIVLKDAPYLNAKTVPYRTQLKDADRLLESYRKNPSCDPTTTLKGNRECPLALDNLPEEVYEREWDMIMIDAPRGYGPDHPGRMAAVFSAAVMARARKHAGNTHVFLHDVDRNVEESYAKEFLCEKYRVGAVGRLWHFEIPPSTNGGKSFC